MASKKLKLTVPRATRVDYVTAVELLRISGDTGLVAAQVDREILNRVAELIRSHWKPGFSLRQWVQKISFIE
jgi:hypothetical protein